MNEICAKSVAVLALISCSIASNSVRAQREDGNSTVDDEAIRMYVSAACAMPSVQKELRLTEDQLASMADVRHHLSELRAFAGVNDRTRKAFADAMKTIQTVLSKKQDERLRELRLQGLGIRALLLPEVVETLELSGGQQSKLQEIASTQQKLLRAISKQTDLPLSEINAKQAKAIQDAKHEALALLSVTQRERFAKMKGPEFDFSTKVPPAKGYGGRKDDGNSKNKRP